MPAKMLKPSFADMSPDTKREFINAQIKSHNHGGLLVFSKTY